MGARLRPSYNKGKMVLSLAFLLAAVPAPAWAEPKKPVEMKVYRLYFPRPETASLGVEEREIEQAESTAGRAKNVVLALLSGPRTKLAPAFFPGRRLRQVFLDQAGTAFVDLAPAEAGSGAGALQERLSVWALVNTLCLNFEEIKAVKILVGGHEAPTLCGHVDLSRALLPDKTLIK